MFFLIVAPVIVMYVRGITYDFNKKTFISTGIFAIRTDPQDAKIFIDKKISRKKSGDIKFLIPGEYAINIQKDGYFPWNKRLNIEPGQVTWVTPYGGKTYLLKQASEKKNLAQKVSAFYYANGLVFYLSGQQAKILDIGSPQDAKEFSLPKITDAIIASDNNGQFILSASASPATLLLLNTTTGKITDLARLFNGKPKFQFANDGRLLALDDTTLYKIDPQNETRTVLLNNIKAFDEFNDNLYYIQIESKNELSLQVSQKGSLGQALITNLPDFANGEIIVTPGKQILLLADGSLYQANKQMEKITDGINGYNYNKKTADLILLRGSELDSYDYYSQNLNLITRSGIIPAKFILAKSVGYAFFANSQGLFAIELDTRSNQNQYQLAENKNVQNFAVDETGENLFFLDNENLSILPIR